jgi:hypothetical protein
MDNRTKTRLANWTAPDYERKIVSAFQEEGYDIVEHDGASFARITTVDDEGANTLAEINLTKVAMGMARVTQ